MEDNFKVFKLISGEEIVANMVEESDYEVMLFFPMVVKTVPRIEGTRFMETIMLSPISYLSGEDVYTIQKSHILFTQPMDPQYEEQYRLSIDAALESLSGKPEHNENEVAELAEKLKNIFKAHIEYDETDDIIEPIVIDNPSKLIH